MKICDNLTTTKIVIQLEDCLVVEERDLIKSNESSVSFSKGCVM